MRCFFDLDGTLADSRDGLFGSFRAGIAAIGAPEPDDATLAGFLGTPLPMVFRAVRPAVDAAGIARGIAAFRAFYDVAGIRENRLYPGVRPMLEALHATGQAGWIVTSKPEPQAVKVAALLGIDHLLAGVVGASLAETDTKTELLARALAAAGADPAEALMLGDRHYDVIGALANGVRPVGALWGYGTEAELREAGCADFVASAAEFAARFVGAQAAA